LLQPVAFNCNLRRYSQAEVAAVKATAEQDVTAAKAGLK